MKRDMDLIRDILLAMEETDGESDYYSQEELELSEVPETAFFYHILLLDEANLIKVQDEISISSNDCYPVRLTWQGHEFLDLIKKDINWNYAKKVMSKTGGMAFEILVKILLQYAAVQAGLAQ